MTYVKYALMKEIKNLLKLFVDIEYVQNVLNNLKNKNNINYAHFADNIIGIKLIKTDIFNISILTHKVNKITF